MQGCKSLVYMLLDFLFLCHQIFDFNKLFIITNDLTGLCVCVCFPLGLCQFVCVSSFLFVQLFFFFAYLFFPSVLLVPDFCFSCTLVEHFLDLHRENNDLKMHSYDSVGSVFRIRSSDCWSFFFIIVFIENLNVIKKLSNKKRPQVSVLHVRTKSKVSLKDKSGGYVVTVVVIN